MTENPQQASKSPSLDEGIVEIADFPVNLARNQLASRFITIDRRSPSSSILLVDEVTLSSNMPRPSHWSIAWSDLMMTMFVLFLVMFAYQTAHEDFLKEKKPEIIGGDTTEALQSTDSSGVSFPFVPIHPGLPLMTAGTIKKIEPVHENFQNQVPEDIPVPAPQPEEMVLSEKIAILVEEKNDNAPPLAATTIPGPDDEIEAPLPLIPERGDNFQEMYTLSRNALENNDLSQFASIDIVPDKTMRIILTGDLMFDIGQSDLSEEARKSLEKVASIISNTPYMINVVGHTDNTPMRSNRFSSNWELSLARAGTVARYLIDEIGMNPNQFVVSGYSSYRPVQPNTTAENRAKNRRVEIIISKRLPPPIPATADNLN